MRRHTPAPTPTAARRPLPGPDHAEVADSLAAVDTKELGSRIRRLRQQQELTQAAACAGLISTAYLSRIETGERRPDLKVLRALAERLGSTPHELLLGLTPQGWSGLEAEHDWAQLSLRTGDPAATLAATTKLIDQLPPTSRLYSRALTTHALALEATGDYEQAALHLEELAEASTESAGSLEVLIALSRVYREAGELGRAIEIGDRARSQIAELQLEGSPESVRLMLTVALAHSENGDVGYASRLCRKALRAAEQLGHAGARAGCYWNASIFESKRGNQPEAVALAQKALAVLDEADSMRHAANLRTQLGILLLRVDPPQVDEAIEHLTAAESALHTSDSSPADLADNRLAQARAQFLRGDLTRARVEAQDALDRNAQGLPIVSAEAYVLLGQVAFHEGDHERARSHYQQAIMALTGVGADRAAAQLWFELGGLWLSVGCTEQALDAFQRAGASTGLRGNAAVKPLRQPTGSP